MSMKKDSIFSRQLFINLVILIIICVLFSITIKRMSEDNYDTYYNQARILLMDEIQSYESGGEISSQFSYIILDLTGSVLDSHNSLEYHEGDVLNLTEVLQTDHSFFAENTGVIKVTFPLYQNNTVNTFLSFYVDKAFIDSKTTLERNLYILRPAIMGCVILLLLVFYRTFYLKRNILNIINEISTSSKAIIKGNYDIAVINSSSKKLLSSEVDELSYGFELMRDELKAKIAQEEKLKRLQKELISCISHDLKTPISTIKAYSEAMRDGLASDKDTSNRYIATIIRKTEVLTKMMNDLMEHSNAELNELSIDKKECYFNDYLRNVFLELDPYIKQKGIDFEHNNQLPNVMVCMDESRISQVIYNLVENSIKYIGEGAGIITISGTYLPEDKQVIISIKDNGVGISLDDIPYIFDRFYRVEKSRSMRILGSGLGLSICKYIIEQHNGVIECKSRIDIGTEFIVKFPIM